MKHVGLCVLMFTMTLLTAACGPAEFASVTIEGEGSKAGAGDPTVAPPPASVAVTDPVQAAKHECGDGNQKKTEICHVPEGNPTNRHTLCLPPPAIEAHLREHNASAAADDEDTLGACK